MVVSTLAVEWIEIFCYLAIHFPLASPPSRWSGLKSFDKVEVTDVIWSPPSRWSGLKFLINRKKQKKQMSPPSRWSGLKSVDVSLTRKDGKVSTLAVEWIEIRTETA